MTGVEERALLEQYLMTCSRIRDGFVASAVRLDRLMPMAEVQVDALTLDEEDKVLAFLKRFEQFADMVHRTLRLLAQIAELGRIERLTPRDVANRAEKLGLVEDAEIWARIVRARNHLTHEYALNAATRVQRMNEAWALREPLAAMASRLKTHAVDEGLIDDRS